ncbi:MAG: CAP domain-containing protein [Lachnospiraceae bacterium]|nr:CAP domain-containing protein [Lachnospiraceae bacterium]
MRKKIKRIAAALLCGALVIGTAACGATKAAVDDVAAMRGKGVGAGETYIDDNAIALVFQATPSSDSLDAASAALALVNTQRASAGLSALAWSDRLAQAAMVRATEIQTSFSHTRPNGTDWWTVDSTVQYGENLAKLYNSADSVVAAWMNSPSHKANIMAADFKSCGIAISRTADNKWYWAQEFGY